MSDELTLQVVRENGPLIDPTFALTLQKRAPRAEGGDRFDAGGADHRAHDVRGCGAGLPGNDLVRAGLDDLARGGAPRLRDLGFPVVEPLSSPELRLYEQLQRDEPDGAQSQYSALICRLVSFESAAEARASQSRAGTNI